jgi:outer membrane protein OmpA-like peptidoglycan-associated protein
VAFIKKYPDAEVVLEGYTDNQGPRDYNHTLSHKRADAVKDSLVREGNIDASRIRTIGYGESRPFDTNETPWGRYMNRRVEILIVSD